MGCEKMGCGKKFSRKDNLRVHIRNVHQGIRPYSCKEKGCGKAFKRKMDLVKHTKGVHLKEKKFDKSGWPECWLCGKKYSRMETVSKHILTAHYQCDLCDEAFEVKE